MSDIRIDQKGKLYTSRISKLPTRVLVNTGTNIIEGTMYLLAGNRLKDELNAGEQFIALTEVQVFAPDGVTRLYDVQALMLNKNKIAWVIPSDTSSPTESSAL